MQGCGRSDKVTEIKAMIFRVKRPKELLMSSEFFERLGALARVAHDQAGAMQFDTQNHTRITTRSTDAPRAHTKVSSIFKVSWRYFANA